jgi:hypothetical protein
MAGREIEKEKSPAISERTDIEDRQPTSGVDRLTELAGILMV